jgi:S-(hydroxymethyl)glutathione dehydrogenase/alcohol dehydrogenase
VPFNISYGQCWLCRHQLRSQCDGSNPQAECGTGHGYTQLLGGYDGGQAEYVRVPYASTNPSNCPRINSQVVHLPSCVVIIDQAALHD